MAIIKCKMCGGDLNITEGMTVAECEYCGTKQTVPNVDNEKKTGLFLRAEKLRRDCDFDRAAAIYDSILTDFPAEPEAYWGLLLCKYGIEYVDDPATGKKVPTCHRSSFDSVMEDENLEKVMDCADAVARKVYRDEAKAIEEIRKGILEVSGKEPPYIEQMMANRWISQEQDAENQMDDNVRVQLGYSFSEDGTCVRTQRKKWEDDGLPYAKTEETDYVYRLTVVDGTIKIITRQPDSDYDSYELEVHLDDGNYLLIPGEQGVGVYYEAFKFQVATDEQWEELH